MSKRLRAGDRVVATVGNNKGKVGVVTSSDGKKIVVEGLNVRKKHIKRTRENPKGRIVDMEMPIAISNVRPCDSEGTPVKLRVRYNQEGHRELYYLQGDQQVLYRSLKKT